MEAFLHYFPLNVSKHKRWSEPLGSRRGCKGCGWVMATGEETFIKQTCSTLMRFWQVISLESWRFLHGSMKCTTRRLCSAMLFWTTCPQTDFLQSAPTASVHSDFAAFFFPFALHMRKSSSQLTVFCDCWEQKALVCGSALGFCAAEVVNGFPIYRNYWTQ